jgi:hypothetical protein
MDDKERAAGLRRRIIGEYAEHAVYRIVRCPLMMPTEPVTACHHKRTWMTTCDLLFKAEWLLLWGISLDTRIVSIQVGNRKVIPINPEPVSALLYYTTIPVEELQDAISSNKFEPSLQQRLDAPLLELGCRLTITIEGPVSHIAFIGLTRS